jgi:hypothetical protein
MRWIGLEDERRHFLRAFFIVLAARDVFRRGAFYDAKDGSMHVKCHVF